MSKNINYILVNIQAVLGLLGIAGNVLTICVFSRPSLKNYSYSFYWRIMAFSDIILLIEAFKNWSYFVFDISGSYSMLIHIYYCIFGDFLTYWTGYVTVWLHTIISIDRLLIIAYPNRLLIFRKRWFQLTLVLILVIYSGLLNLRMPLNYRLETVNSTSNISKIKPTILYTFI